MRAAADVRRTNAMAARERLYRARALGGLAAASLLLFGCGPDKRAAPGRNVLRRTSSRIRGMDPIKATDVDTAMAVGRVYEGLLQYNYLARPYRIEPCLAAAMPEIAPDGLSYTFRIRDDVHFQDNPCFTQHGGRGRAVNAADFVYAIKRVADVKAGSPGYWVFRDRIAGLDAFRARSEAEAPTDYDQELAGLRALDRRTLRITLKAPYPQLLWILTMPYAFAVPREAVEYYGLEFVNHPVGTGPYTLAAWRRNHRMEFARNPEWATGGRTESVPAVPGARLPFYERIRVYVVDDPSTRWLMFLRGDLDLSAISRDNWDAVVGLNRTLTPEMRARGIQIVSHAELATFYTAFNMDDPVVGPNKKLRQALTCAFDTGQWIEFYNRRIMRAIGPIPPGVAGYRDMPAPYPFDLERARALLAEAGYPGGQDPGTGRRLKLTIELGRRDSETRESTELLIAFMDRLGVALSAEYHNWPTFLKRCERRQAQMFRIGWIADYPDAQNFLQLFYGPNCSPGPNRANYRNPAFDRLYDRVRVMQDGPARTALYEQMADLLMEDCPWIFMFHRVAYTLHQRHVHDYVPSDFPYGMEKYYRCATTSYDVSCR